LNLGEDEAKRNVRLGISVVVYVDSIHGIGVEVRRLGERIAVEDQDSPRRVCGRLEGVKVSKVEPLVPERRTQLQAGKMVRHSSPFLNPIFVFYISHFSLPYKPEGSALSILKILASFIGCISIFWQLKQS